MCRAAVVMLIKRGHSEEFASNDFFSETDRTAVVKLATLKGFKRADIVLKTGYTNDSVATQEIRRNPASVGSIRT
jgi:hypothetical protein